MEEKEPLKLAGLFLPCPKCNQKSYKQYHCKIPTYFCTACNEAFFLKDEWVEQDLTNTRQYKDITKLLPT